MSATKKCVYCDLEYKISDSRPYPNSKSKERIHNKCLMKKNLSDKKQSVIKEQPVTSSDQPPTSCAKAKQTNDPTTSLIERVAKEEYDTRKAINEKKLERLLEEKRLESEKDAKNSGQFFFDVKAGIAQEKKRYLHHRKVCEMATRFDDSGFKEEAAGRAYDHSGKDLNSLGDSDNDNASEPEAAKSSAQEASSVRSKRKLDPRNSQEQQATKQPRIRVDDKNPCWFCLSSPKVEKHLILAIGEFCYLTLAKGGLNDAHLLIIPIEHIQSLNSREDNSRELVDELERFKRSLIEYYSSENRGVVFFERNFRSVHWQLQVVPVPIDSLNTLEERIKSISAEHYKNSNYVDIPENCSLHDVIPPNVPYFYWQLEPRSKRFVTQIQVKGSFFPIQFGRIILADTKILNCPDRVDWKSCTSSQKECTEIVEAFKERYKDYDFT